MTKEKNISKGKTLCVYVPCSWPFVYRDFMASFLKVMHPMHMVPLKQFGITNYFHMLYPKFPICKNRNEAVMKAKEFDADYILFLDSDMTFPDDIAMQLAKHQLPIVAGMYWHQSPPHFPLAYKLDPESGEHHYKHYVYYPRDSLFEVDLTGMGCMWVDTKVFDDIKMPYFDYLSTREDGLKNVTEDVIFCEKVKEAGYSIYMDPMVKCSHLRMDKVNDIHFDSYMDTYKTTQALEAQFGSGND